MKKYARFLGNSFEEEIRVQLKMTNEWFSYSIFENASSINSRHIIIFFYKIKNICSWFLYRTNIFNEYYNTLKMV